MNTKATSYMNYLEEEGYRPRIDDDGDVVFKHEGRTYYLDCNDDDDTYFRLSTPGFWELKTDDDRMCAWIAASNVNTGIKVAKVCVSDDATYVYCSTELFCDPLDGFRSVFVRCLESLQAAVDAFAEVFSDAQSHTKLRPR